jgi:hypothetical protein
MSPKHDTVVIEQEEELMSVLRTSKPDDREETLPQPWARKTAAIRKAGARRKLVKRP